VAIFQNGCRRGLLEFLLPTFSNRHFRHKPVFDISPKWSATKVKGGGISFIGGAPLLTTMLERMDAWIPTAKLFTHGLRKPHDLFGNVLRIEYAVL